MPDSPEQISPRAYVVVVNWNGWQDTIECLESVFRLNYPDYRVIVCDNGSEDDSLQRVKDWADGRLNAEPAQDSAMRELTYPPVAKPIGWVEHDRATAELGGDSSDADAGLILIRTGSNLGFAGGNNVGLRYALARGDVGFAWLLNNDTVVKPDALTRMTDRLREEPRAGICGSTILSYEDPNMVVALGGATFSRWLGVSRHIGFGSRADAPIDAASVERRMGHVAGASMLVTSAFLRDVGLMEEDYHIYFEELDWAYRARGRYTSVYAPGSVVYHKIGRSTGSGTDTNDRNWKSDAYLLRNRLVITRRFFPIAVPLVCAGLVITLINRVRRRQWHGLGRIVKVLFGGSLG